MQVNSPLDIYTVSRLNFEAGALLEGHFTLINIEGEISNFTHAVSGHWYFVLKDEKSRIRCAMFRNRNFQVKCKPEDGSQVLLRASVGIYAARGEYQLNVISMEEAGTGRLAREFEQLKAELKNKGWFDEKHKTEIPAVPRTVGVISSPAGAAVKDILITLNKRFPAANVIIYPVPVQGEKAPVKIAAQLEEAQKRAECDVFILARGGGSLEDLWAFNTIEVAAAVFAVSIPVIAGIGHESDVTIADLVADARAPTPTGAAQLAVPAKSRFIEKLDHINRNLSRTMAAIVNLRRAKLNLLAAKLSNPAARLDGYRQIFDEFALRLESVMGVKSSALNSRLEQLRLRIISSHPGQKAGQIENRLQLIRQKINRRMTLLIELRISQTDSLNRRLNALSPLAVLARGYAIAFDKKKKIIKNPTDVKPGEQITVKVDKGDIKARISNPGGTKA